MRRDLVGRAIHAGQTLRNVQRLLAAELHGSVSLPPGRRIWGWRQGFTSESTKGFGVTKENRDLYVSDYARYVKTPRINGVMSSALHNKVVFSRLVTSHGGRAPENYCLVGDHGFLSIGDRFDMSTEDGIIAACMTGERFVVKPCGGGGGLAVTVISSADGRLALNGRETTEEEFRAFLGRLSGAIISEFVVQGRYAAEIFPHSTNAIRIITMWDYDKGAPFVPFAGHRFGRTSSIPVDNITQGGIPAFVDVQSGRLEAATVRTGTGARARYAQHPDTGAQIEGVVIPHWDRVTGGLMELARKMAYIPYIGWDIIVTDDGFCAIEGNNHPHLGHQDMAPLLKDPRVRAFYERFDAL